MNYVDGDICPICGGGALVRKAITETYEYKGQILEMDDYVVWSCPSCEEYLVASKDSKDTGRRIREFQRKVDGLLSASEIKRIRVKLGYTQDALSELLGGGAKAFARYENSDVVQSVAMDNQLRLLDERPASISILENKHKAQPRIIVTSMIYHTKLDDSRMVANYGQTKH